MSRVKGLNVQVSVPGDKSISHRAALLGAMARGKTHVLGFAPGLDCWATLQCIKALGVQVHVQGSEVLIDSPGAFALQEPSNVLDCMNSGTTMRLMSGVLAGQPFMSVLTGDSSLRNRPMARVVEPLRAMGARVDGRCGGTKAPLYIRGPAGTRSHLKPLRDYRLPVASAQVKSCLLLAGLLADGETTILETVPTRDHTERMLGLFGASIATERCSEGTLVRVHGPQRLAPAQVEVPGDFSSAAFWLAAGAIVPESTVTVTNVGLNPLRTGFLAALRDMGCDVEVRLRPAISWEPVGDVTVSASSLKAIQVLPEQVPSMVDEIPVLAVCAAMAQGTTCVRGAGELRHKESDRISAIVQNLRAMGASAGELEDGFWVEGGRPLRGARVNTMGDHRIAMAFAVAALVAEGDTVLDHPSCIDVSYPGFLGQLNEVVGKEKVMVKC
ncbi:MAG: 3-phosphoshikimate 1-carboxyvinyltransferase [Bacillota bacterium]